MAQNYTRQSAFSDGDTITATLFNDEYNQLVNTFTYSSSDASATGHRHDGSTGEGGNIYRIGDLDFLNKIEADSSNNRWGFWVEVSSIAVEQLRIQDGALVPVTDNDIDLGTSSLEFKNLYLDGTAKVDTLVVDETATITGATTLSSTLGVTGATTLSSTLALTGAATLSSDLTVAGNAVLNGNTTIGNAATDTVTITADVSSNIIPSADSTYTLGDSSNYWSAGYIDALTTTGNVSVGGNLTVTGNATISGNLTFGDADTDTVSFSADVSSHILPDVDDTYDLGSSTKEWRNLYVDGTANIDSLVADTADINGGTIDGATIATSDVTVGAGKTLDVSAGTLTLADNQISGDKVEGGTIAATTITSLASTTVDTTNIEVTNLKAKDGTSAGSIADTTGVVTLASSVLTTTDINGGTIDGTTIATSDITVGVGKTLDVSAGTFTVANDQISGDAINGGTATPTNLTVSGTTSLAGASTTADITFGDNDKAIFGAGSDLQIYHDGSNSYINEVGTGSLRIRSNQIRMEAPDSQNMVIVTEDAGVQAFYNGTQRLEVTNTGIDVTGTVTADGLTVDGNADVNGSLDVGTSTSGVLNLVRPSTNYIRANETNGAIAMGVRDAIRLFTGQGAGEFLTNERLRIASNGDISFYEDTGTTPKFFWDASAESLGIGTTSPSALLHVSGNNPALKITDTSTAGSILLQPDISSSGADRITSDVNNLGIFTSAAAKYILFGTEGSERARIDASGNLLVGTTQTPATLITTSTTSHAGVGIADGYLSIARDLTGSAGTGGLAFFNRLATDGPIVDFRKDGAQVGSIGVDSTDNFYIECTTANHPGLYFFGTTVQPRYNGANSNGEVDLGRSVNRFKDLYLSGTANAAGLSVDGGTIKLDGNYPVGTSNVALGDAALDSITSGGSANVAIGSSAGTALTLGDESVAVGFEALMTATTGSENVGVGYRALKLTTGNSNVGVGKNALAANTSASNNTAIGTSALFSNTTASNNTAVGYQSLYANTTGTNNVSVGFRALYSNTTADQNAAFGTLSLFTNSTGNYNTALGQAALYSNTANNNTAVGYQAGYSNTTGNQNVAVGAGALQDSTTGSDNVAIGQLANENNTTGSSNVSVGRAALNENTSGNNNVAIGRSALLSNTTASNNTAVGYQAGYSNTTGVYLTALGTQAGYNNTTANYNVMIGRKTGFATTTGANNAFVGTEAGVANTTGGNNTALGTFALGSNTTASNNTAVGYQSLYANTTGGDNTAVGYESLKDNTTGVRSVALGHGALQSNTTGSRNVAIGRYALRFGTSGDDNVAIGDNALNDNTASDNTAVGSSALLENTSGSSNTALGFQALKVNTTASSNTAVGYQSLTSNTTGTANTALGTQAGQDVTTGNRNTTVGAIAGANVTTADDATLIGYGSGGGAVMTGHDNTAVGVNSLNLTTSGASNTAVGRSALEANTTGAANTVIGKDTFKAASTASYNVAVGAAVLENYVGTGNTFNTAVGFAAMENTTTGYYNTTLGAYAGNDISTATTNTYVGYQAGLETTTGSANTAVGANALDAHTTGARNTALGDNALGALTTGDNNLGVGRSSGLALTTGVNNTFVGAYNGSTGGSGELITTGSKNTILGSYNGNQGGLDIRTSSNYIVLSDGDGNPRGIFDGSGQFLVGAVTTATSSSVGFKVLNPAAGHWDPMVVTDANNSSYSCWDLYSTNTSSYRFYVSTNGTVNAVSTTITAISDQRLKENIRDLDDGLATVMALKPRKFDWKEGKGAGTKNARGFIAQEFEQVLPDLIDEWKDPAPEGEEPYKAVRADLIPTLVKAIQELKTELDAAKAEIEALKGA